MMGLRINGRALSGLLAGGFLVVGCRDKTAATVMWEGEQERVVLEQQLALKKFRFENSFLKDSEALTVVRQSLAADKPVLLSLRETRASLVVEVAAMESSREEFRLAAIRSQRERAIGTTFPNFELASGRKLEGVTVASIDDAGVTLRHAFGSARVGPGDLAPGQRAFFGLEEDLALAAMQKESRASVEYEQWVERQMVTIGEKKERAAELARRDQQDARQKQNEVAARTLAAAKVRPLGQPASHVGSGYSSYSSAYSSYRTYRPTYRYYYTRSYVPSSYVVPLYIPYCSSNGLRYTSFPSSLGSSTGSTSFIPSSKDSSTQSNTLTNP